MDFEKDADKGVLVTDEALNKISLLAKAQSEKEIEIAKQAAYLQQLTEDLRKISEDQLPDAMLAIGLEEFKLKTGEKVSIKKLLFTSIPIKSKDEAHMWLRNNGFADIIKNDIVIKLTAGEDELSEEIQKTLAQNTSLKDLPLTQKSGIHGGSLKAFIKEQLGKGREFPDCFSIFEKKISEVK